MKNNNDMIVTRFAELVPASTQKSQDPLKQVQGDGLLVETHNYASLQNNCFLQNPCATKTTRTTHRFC